MQPITGHTYIFDGTTCIGIYRFPDNTCLLIDTGPGEVFAKKILQEISSQSLRIEAIFNTHAHADHCGGNRLIQETEGCSIYASHLEAVFIDNPILGPFCLYSADPVRALKNKFIMPPASRVTHLVEAGTVKIKGEPFEMISLPGHSLGHMGIMTPDGVLFTGDSLIAAKQLRDFPFLYMADVKSQIETLDILEGLALNQVCISHGGLDGFEPGTIKKNRQLIVSTLEFIKSFIVQPRGREEIVAAVVNEWKLPVNRSQYYLISASISAYLSFLCNNKQARLYPAGDCLKFQGLT